jgi:hypothetical protein
VDEVEDLLKQDQPFAGLSQPGADQYAIETVRAQCPRGYHLGGLAEIDQAACDVKARRPDARELRIDVGAKHLWRELRHSRVVDECRIDADGEDFLRHIESSV